MLVYPRIYNKRKIPNIVLGGGRANIILYAMYYVCIGNRINITNNDIVEAFHIMSHKITLARFGLTQL